MYIVLWFLEVLLCISGGPGTVSDEHYTLTQASQVAQMVKNLPAMQETWVWSLGQEDPLEKGMATHCSILGWEIPWTEEPGGLQSLGLQRVGHNLATQQRQTKYFGSDCNFKKVVKSDSFMV